jgi:phage gp16-like protein
VTTKELEAVLNVLQRVGPKVNPFRDEAVAYVKKDLAIREQQRAAAREMNRDNYEWPFYGQ